MPSDPRPPKRPARPPAGGPTRAPPGCAEKLLVLAERARLGLPLFSAADEADIDWARLLEELGGAKAVRDRLANTDRARSHEAGRPPLKRRRRRG